MVCNPTPRPTHTACKTSAIGDGHEPWGNNCMADKYVKSPYTPHHPHNVETKYVKIAKEGAKGTTHA